MAYLRQVHSLLCPANTHCGNVLRVEDCQRLKPVIFRHSVSYALLREGDKSSRPEDRHPIVTKPMHAAVQQCWCKCAACRMLLHACRQDIAL